jgi:phenylpyruvate tautomerase PptA (4-oxalocrotonate tautomerase family)
MPLFTITMRSGRRGAAKGAVSAAIHAASVSAGYPKDDMFQRFFSLEADDLLIDPTYPMLPKPRTDELLMIEVLVSSGTQAKQKHALLAALIARLDMVGVDKNDVMVFFGEVDRASSSFGNGKLAPPVAIG